MGSALELDYHWLLARDPGLIPEPDHHAVEHRVGEVRRMLASLISKTTAPRAS